MSTNGATVLTRSPDSLPGAKGVSGTAQTSVATDPRQASAAHRSVVYIGPLESIAAGQGRSFTIEGRAIAVFRQRDGRVFATDNQCPHRGGPLAEGIVGDGKVICPLHNWKIDLATGQCLGESVRLRTYDVYVVDGHVWIRCGTAAEGTE